MHDFEIVWVEETTSTNSAVLHLAKKSSSKKLVLAAHHQTEGRGQFGRKWISQPHEDLLFSIYFEPDLKPALAAPITQVACQAVQEVLSSYQISCAVKPPNDLMFSEKKICGILTESSSRGENLEYVIVGIGLNVNSSETTLLPEAISMKMASRLGATPSKNKTENYDRAQLLDKILCSFQKHFALYHKETKKPEN